MNARYSIVLLSAVILGSVATSRAQDSTVPKKTVVTANLSYQNKLHFFGRTDSLQSSAMLPSVGLELKNGLYATGSFIFFRNPLQPLTYTGTAIEAGYRFPSSEHFSGNLFFSKFLYKDNSELVQSALQAQTGVNLAWNNKVLNVNLGGDLKFSDKTDVGATAGLDHLFIWPVTGSKLVVAFNPSAYLYAGTQHFQQTYNKRQNLGPLPIGGGNQSVTENVTRFNILAYEFSAPLVLVHGKFNASVTPAYIVPRNLVTVENRPDLSERGGNMFYATFSIGVRL